MQSYDGDDWGVADSDEEDAELDEPAPALTPLPPKSSHRLPSDSNRSRASDSLPSIRQPSLHIQTQQQTSAAQPHSDERDSAVTGGASSIYSGTGTDSAVSPQPGGDFRAQNFSPVTVLPSNSPSMPDSTDLPVENGHNGQPQGLQQAPRAGVPESLPRGSAAPAAKPATTSGTDPSAFVRPSDIYRRMEEEKEKQGQSLDSARPSLDAAEGQPCRPGSIKPTEQASGVGLPELPTKSDQCRLSTSPQLPNFARISGFGIDMFSNDGSNPAGGFSGAKDTEPGNVEPCPEAERTPTLAPTQVAHEEGPAPNTSGVGMASASMMNPVYPDGVVSPESYSAAASISDGNSRFCPHVSQQAVDANALITDERSGSQDASSSTASSSTGRSKHVSAVSDVDQSSGARLQTESPSVSPSSTPGLDTAQAPFSTAAARSAVSAEEQREATLGSNSVIITPTEPLNPRKSLPPSSNFEPQPLRREPTDGTVTSSPDKDSDKLREEIIKSLGPAGTDTTPLSSLPVDRIERQSGHVHGLDGNDEAKLAEKSPRQHPSKLDSTTSEDDGQEMEPSGVESVPLPQSTAPGPQGHESALFTAQAAGNASEAKASGRLRRKFSWELDPNDEADPSGGAPRDSSQEQPETPSDPEPYFSTPVGMEPTALSPITDVTEPTTETSGSPSVPRFSRASGGADSPSQKSKASTVRQASEQEPRPESPSPVSQMSEMATRQSQDDSGLLDKRSKTSPPLSDSDLVAATEECTSASAGRNATRSGHSQIMPFRDIMVLQNPSDRIMKYDEARDLFASLDSGLNDWLSAIALQHPEHVDANFSQQGKTAGGLPGPGAPSTQPRAAPSVQQPYYQQYLNASSPAPSTTVSARSRLAGLQAQAASSAFGHSSNQIGTKGKEIMQSAGKMGKDWFSKGRSKLRGTGDKVFH